MKYLIDIVGFIFVIAALGIGGTFIANRIVNGRTQSTPNDK
jgi:hypothetical protein